MSLFRCVYWTVCCVHPTVIGILIIFLSLSLSLSFFLSFFLSLRLLFLFSDQLSIFLKSNSQWHHLHHSHTAVSSIPQKRNIRRSRRKRRASLARLLVITSQIPLSKTTKSIFESRWRRQENHCAIVASLLSSTSSILNQHHKTRTIERKWTVSDMI